MLRQDHIAAKAASASVAPLLLALPAVLFASLDGSHHPLSLAQMSQSRGGSQNKVRGFFFCDQLKGNQLTKCTQVGGSCTTCQEPGYDDVGQGEGGGLNAGTGYGSCGNVFNGTCDAQLICNKNTGGDTGKGCAKPPSPPTQQP